MSLRVFSDFSYAIKKALFDLETYGADVDPGHWQGVKTDHSMVTKELQDVAFRVPMPVGNNPEYQNQEIYLENLHHEIQPNLPWADDHFEERVSRVPSNPGEQYKNWPWWQPAKELQTAADAIPPKGDREEAIQSASDRGAFRFTHTYQERFWPKWAPEQVYEKYSPWGSSEAKATEGTREHALLGIRYPYGDLDDVVTLLLREPHTRQGYMPIFFPEDTGAVHGGRIPCTLGYYFLLRNGRLNMKYTIRSCDAVRHFRDDLYLAARLLLWVLEELQYRRQSIGDQYDETGGQDWDKVVPGDFTFHAYSFHVHKGDLHYVRT